MGNPKNSDIPMPLFSPEIPETRMTAMLAVREIRTLLEGLQAETARREGPRLENEDGGIGAVKKTPSLRG
jgi:hypothetical protein